MSRSRASALLASVMLVLATVGGAVLTPTAASANPRPQPQPTSTQYPPTAPALVVNRGAVWQGSSVRAAGRQYQPGERVTVRIYLYPRGGNAYRLLRTATVVANAQGNLSFGVRATNAGWIAIRAIGQTSGQKATAYVYAYGRGRGGWALSPVAFTTSDKDVAAKVAAPETDTTLPVVAGLAVMAMAGGALVTRRTVRRKRTTA